MAKSVFRPGEITQTDEKVMLKLSHSFVPETIEEVVEEVVDAPAAAPQTFDAGVIAAVAAIVSAAGYAVSKKR